MNLRDPGRPVGSEDAPRADVAHRAKQYHVLQTKYSPTSEAPSTPSTRPESSSQILIPPPGPESSAGKWREKLRRAPLRFPPNLALSHLCIVSQGSLLSAVVDHSRAAKAFSLHT